MLPSIYPFIYMRLASVLLPAKPAIEHMQAELDKAGLTATLIHGDLFMQTNAEGSPSFHCDLSDMKPLFES